MYKKRHILKCIVNIIIIILIIKEIINEDNYNNNSIAKKNSHHIYAYNSSSQIKENIPSFRKLAIVLPIDSKRYKKRYIYSTLKNILKVNYNFTLYLIYNNKCPKISNKKIIFKRESFSNILTAFNIALNIISNFDYIAFLFPGIFLTPKVYDFLYFIENHDIYQIYSLNREQNFKQMILEEKEFEYNFKNYDLINELPSNIALIYDKIYKVSLLKKNKIKFILHEKSIYYFNLLCFSYAKDLLYINSIGILHKFKIPFFILTNNLQQEANIMNKIFSINKNITKNIIENITKIDYIFPYVTTRDSYWKNLYNEYISEKESKYASGIHRFRDNGMLKYLLRSIEKNLPWINKVHMIVMADTQVPEWINRQEVHIIYHSDFIPKKYLPTFSSRTIEIFLPFLPLVQENFIYGNDDLIPLKRLSKKFFFKGNIPCYNLNIRDYIESYPEDTVRRNAFNLILEKNQKKKVITTQHSTISFKMSLLRKCFEKYKKKILESISPFREDKNLNQYIYSFYQMIEGTILNKPHRIGLFDVNPEIMNKILDGNFKKYDFICLNDQIEMSENDWLMIQSKFEKIFPKKSKFEKTIS